MKTIQRIYKNEQLDDYNNIIIGGVVVEINNGIAGSLCAEWQCTNQQDCNQQQASQLLHCIFHCF